MKLRTWTYFFKSAFLNILHDRLIHLICMGTITISMLLFGAFLLLYVNLDRWINEWGESLSMSVYLEDGIDAKTRQGIEQALKGLRGADLKGYVSKDEAIKNLRQSLGDQAGLLDGLKDNPLPASFEIHFRDRGADRINPHAGVSGPLPDKCGNGGIIIYRFGVRHAGDRGETACGCRPGTTGNGLLIFLARLAQMHVHIDKSGDDPTAGDIYHLRFGWQITFFGNFAEGGNTAIFQEQIPGHIPLLDGIDNPAVFKEDRVCFNSTSAAHPFSPPMIKYRSAILIATPLVT